MNVGVILPSLGISQLAFLTISQCNQNENDCFVFYYELEFPCIQPNFSCFNISEIHGFEGIMIATDIDSCITMNKSVGNTTKVFYVWDLEWLRKDKGDFNHNMEAFRNPDTHIVCRSVDHARVVENYCNKQVGLITPSMNVRAIIDKYGDNK